jgi:hypothetical protein
MASTGSWRGCLYGAGLRMMARVRLRDTEPPNHPDGITHLITPSCRSNKKKTNPRIDTEIPGLFLIIDKGQDIVNPKGPRHR